MSSSKTNTKKKAIKSKLANLINALPNDVCIKTRITNWTLDFAKYFSINDINTFVNMDINELILSNNKNKGVLQDELYSLKTPEEFLNYLSENDIFLSKTRIEKITSNFSKFKDPTIQLILSKTTNQNRKIDAIVKKSKTIDDNSGIYSLYLGTQFLSGITHSGVQINAPLLFIPLEITRASDTYVIKQQNNNTSFVVNEKLLSLLMTEYKVDISIMDIVHECENSKSIEPIIHLLENNFKFSIKRIDNDGVFNSECQTIPSNSFHLFRSYICGIYEPTGGALKRDLEKLIKLGIDPFDNNDEYDKSKFINEELNSNTLFAIGRPSNVYQKYAIRSALAQNTIIFGPPGTGKSEVITNIIINALINSKTILLAAEKRVALDVIIKRLGSVANFALYINNLKNKSEFYNKILYLSNQLENMLSDSFIESNSININNCLANTLMHRDELKKYFIRFANLLSNKDSNGTDFNQYLELLNQVDQNALRFFKQNNTLEYLQKIVYYYSFSSIETFFTKMNEYRKFLSDYKISYDHTSLLKQQKQDLYALDVQYNFLNFLRSYQDNFAELKKQFISFLETTKIITNRRMMSNLNKNVWLLKEQKIKLLELEQSYPLFNRDLLRYLIDKSNKIQSFVSKCKSLKTTLQFQQSFDSFITSTKLSHYINLETNIGENERQQYFSIFKLFVGIPNNDEKYLLQLHDLENRFIVDQNIVLSYFNHWLNEQYILDLAEKNLVFFSNDDLANFTAISHITNDDYNAITRIISFEKEILQNDKVIDVDLHPIITSYRNAMEDDVNKVTDAISNYYLNLLKIRLSSLDSTTKHRIREVFSIAKRNARTNVPINEFIQNYYNELKILFPVWISIPELIAQSLPLEKDIFDYGIFDEASQIFMERAYPIVYRCKIKIVAGDDKQLKPTSFFAIRTEIESQNYEYSDNDQVDSLLDRAKVSLWAEYHLRNHYRSLHRDLIQFSNDYIYENNLQFVNRNGIIKHAIHVINVDGVNDEGINKDEATKIYELLIENITKFNKIIVVTFGIKQSTYIEQLIFKNTNLCPAIFEKYNSGDLIICSIENVQGNEGDLVILSVTYGKDLTGKFRSNFGPVLMDGGMNRLNVAITRAKEEMIIVKSFAASEMSVNINNPNARLLYKFINYCDNLDVESVNKHSIATIAEHRWINRDIARVIEQKLINFPSLKLIENYDIGSLIIDFAIIDTSTSVTKLAIIVNKFYPRQSIQQMFESLDQYYFIGDRGYNTYWLDEYFWVKNKDLAINKLNEIISEL